MTRKRRKIKQNIVFLYRLRASPLKKPQFIKKRLLPNAFLNLDETVEQTSSQTIEGCSFLSRDTANQDHVYEQ
jgi:hypothetical protein